MSGNGVPIRLVRNDGQLIQIMATDVALDVERKTGGIPMPFTGSTRLGFDFNLNNASIVINGVITDDDIVHIGSSNKKAKAKIDFSVTHTSVTTISGNVGWVNNDDAATIAPSNTFADMTHGITLQAQDGSSYTIWFRRIAGSVANQSGYDAGSSRHWIGVYNSSASASGTAAEIADNLKDLILADSTLQTKFTASLATSAYTDEANTTVVITQITAGSNGNTSTPSMTSDVWPSGVTKPYHVRFYGGYSVTSKSAGDKVMDLWGTLNNSNNGGGGAAIMGAVAGAGVAAAIVASGGTLAPAGVALFSAGGAVGMELIKDQLYGDYIIGIQIPYNSTVKADGAKYKAQNFWMPTGLTYMKDDKGSEESQDASTEFDSMGWNSDKTGIKGTIQKATFTKMGGEPIYSFTIVFAPMDWII
jgi:hypothetical protein